MIYKKRRPHPSLAAYVDCIWLLTTHDAVLGDPEPVLPDGKTELIVHFGDQFQLLDSKTNKFARQNRLLFSGQISKRITLRSLGKIGMVAVRFLPAGAARFCRFSFGDILNQVVSPSEVFGQDVNRLEDLVASATSDDQRMDHMEQYLIDRLSFSAVEDAVIQRACGYILSSGGECEVRDMVSILGISERQLERRFNQHVGINPKTLMRITRFQRFIHLKQTTSTLNLTDAALMCGYYDQAHLIREFKTFADLAPTHFLSQPHVISDLFTSPG